MHNTLMEFGASNTWYLVSWSADHLEVNTEASATMPLLCTYIDDAVPGNPVSELDTVHGRCLKT